MTIPCHVETVVVVDPQTAGGILLCPILAAPYCTKSLVLALNINGSSTTNPDLQGSSLDIIQIIRRTQYAPGRTCAPSAETYHCLGVWFKSCHLFCPFYASPAGRPSPASQVNKKKHSRIVLHQLQLQGETLRGRVTRLEEEVAFSKESSAKILVDARGQMECLRAENDKVKAA